MEKVVVFVVADNKNLKHYKVFEKTLRYFHPDVDLVLFGENEINATKDPHIFYRAKPYFAKFLFEQGYTRVIGADADQIVLGDLSFLLSTDDFDIGTVLNFNPTDIEKYGPITVGGIPPDQYYNNGLVVMRNPEFVQRWLDLCYHPHFQNYQFREQDFLNILAHYGGYTVRCFDNEDGTNDYAAWHGLLNKGQGNRMVVQDDKVILPANTNGYPIKDVEVKVYHYAGGNNEPDKGNFRLHFSEEVVQFIDKMLAHKAERKNNSPILKK